MQVKNNHNKNFRMQKCYSGKLPETVTRIRFGSNSEGNYIESAPDVCSTDIKRLTSIEKRFINSLKDLAVANSDEQIETLRYRIRKIVLEHEQMTYLLMPYFKVASIEFLEKAFWSFFEHQPKRVFNYYNGEGLRAIVWDYIETSKIEPDLKRPESFLV